ncbi:MAG: hypothetical protein WEB04_11870 [Dehalococcoidia bacterium]
MDKPYKLAKAIGAEHIVRLVALLERERTCDFISNAVGRLLMYPSPQRAGFCHGMLVFHRAPSSPATIL